MTVISAAAAACVGSIALSFAFILLTNALAYGLRRLMRSI